MCCHALVTHGRAGAGGCLPRMARCARACDQPQALARRPDATRAPARSRRRAGGRLRGGVRRTAPGGAGARGAADRDRIGARSALHELEERRVLAGRLLLLIEEGQVVLVKLLEPLIPRDVLELVLAGTPWEVDAQDPRVAVVARPTHARRCSIVLLDPAPDLVVIGGRPRV